MKRVSLIVCLCLCLGLGVTIFAQVGDSPPQIAEDIRQSLFDAQVAMMSGDTDLALQAVQDAEKLYQDSLGPAIMLAAPQIDARLNKQFALSLSAVEDGDVTLLAAVRSQVWTSLLQASSHIVYASIRTNDSGTAALWLPLRDFRPSTRFSRPSADATLAVNALSAGRMTPDQALTAVHADLLDTYQTQLTGALNDVDEAHIRGFSLRRAEETGLVVGYFEILADAYGEQRGPESLAETRAYFQQLLVAAVSGDDTSFAEARAQIDAVLVGFRAAPLSDSEIARRAGQLTRFVSLISVEYARGVRNGVVTNDIEIQEAITFHEGSVAAFMDIQTALGEIDPQATARVRDLLVQAQTQIREVADPMDLQATTDEISQLLTATMPAEWLESSASSDVDVIVSVLDQMQSAAAQGEYSLAESSRLEAYALLELGLEQRLVGFAPDLAARIESLFWQGTPERSGLAVLLANEAPVSDIRATLADLKSALSDAQLVLNAGSAPEAVIGNAAIIVFREGLEAVLILASLLASLRTAEEVRYRRPLVAGAALAFAATGITWVIAHNLLTVLLPLGERLEAIVSLIAIGVLLLITNWFFHKVYWVGWMANFHTRKRHIIGGVISVSIGQSVGLVLLGFTSIYREGFETVLFLQSLVLEAGIPVVLQGVALGLLATSIVGVITFKLQVRLPYKKMLIVTGVMIGGVLLVMVGHTVHVMQTIGWLPITPIANVYLPFWMGQWFGLFATWQGIILQFTAASFVIGSYFIAEWQNKQRRSQVIDERARSTAA